MQKKQMFYLQDSRSYVGNSPLWWGKGDSGYTCDIEQAQLYTEEEAMKLFESRKTDIPWKKEDVEKAMKKMVDSQYLKKDDSDGFYSKLQEKKDNAEKDIKIREEENLLKDYIQNELSAILEYVRFDFLKDWIEFEEAFEEDKKRDEFEFHEHYFPTSYYKTSEEIFEDLIKYDFLFECKECKKFTRVCKRDEEYKDLCDLCGEEKWISENPDD